jgi:hypothetical protein
MNRNYISIILGGVCWVTFFSLGDGGGAGVQPFFLIGEISPMNEIKN